MKKRILASLLALATMLLTACSSGNIFNPVIYTDVVINELLADNGAVLADENGQYGDWIELYNPTGKSINLAGYGISDNPNQPYKYTLPEVTLGKKEYLVIFMDGANCIGETGTLHGSFKLSSAGDETVLLTSPSGKTLSVIAAAATPTDVSVGLAEESGEYVFFLTPTPGKKNGGEYTISSPAAGETKKSDLGVLINEYMAKNTVLLDADGDYSPWVELYNPTEKEVSVGGCALTDDPAEPDKWKIPEGTVIPADGYLLIYLSGKNKTQGSELHASFKLSDTDTALIFSDKLFAEIDRLTPVSLTKTLSYGRSESDKETWLYFPRPTPGRANTTVGFADLESGTVTAWADTVYISEVMSVNKTTCKVSGSYTDWVELYNPTDTAVPLNGWYLSDSPDNPRFFEFPSGMTVAAGGTLLLSAATLPFSLSAEGETLLLTNASGMTVDRFETGKLREGISSGRNENGERVFYTLPTPNEKNATTYETGYTASPVFSQDGGCVASSSVKLSLSAAEGAVIYYTLDGSEPTENASVYRAPLLLTENTVVRAAAKTKGRLISNAVTRTFIFNESHDLPVVCLSSAPDGLFSESSGILATGYHASSEYPYTGANYWKDWERPVGFEFYTEEGALGTEFNAGLKIAGQYSRAQAQKSFKVVLRGEYGQSSVTYPFFRDYDVSTFKSLILRTSGQDWNSLKLRDAFFAQVIKGQMDLDYMEYRFCALYINGEYWGLYCLREHTNADYIESHTGLDADKVDLIKGNRSVKAGSITAYNELCDYLKTHDLSVQENFDYVASKVDTEEWANWWITETFFSNTDTGNIKFYCGQDGTGKWRWILFDLDWGMWPSTYFRNRLDRMLDPKGHGTGKMFSTLFARKFMENEEFKNRFIETYAEHLNTTFSPERMFAVLDRMAEEIRTEIPKNNERWGVLSESAWNRNLTRMKEMLTERVALSKEHLRETFNLSEARMKELFPNG